MFNDQFKHIILLQSGKLCDIRGLIVSYYPRVVHASNHVFTYGYAVVRGCLARKKYRCLQNEKESKDTRKVQRDTRKTISESRVCLPEFYAKYSVSSSIMVSQYGWHTEILRLS
jgi:hypothetical protein